MCNNPITTNGVTFACNRCNECYVTKVNLWVGRAMAEKETSAYTYLLALTYGNDTQEKRDGARIFRYSDLQKMFKRLRKAAASAGYDNGLRYIVCGELGSKKGRVHWHVIIFADFDLLEVGVFRYFQGRKPLMGYDALITTNPNREKRLAWTLWPHGLVVIQDPDGSGMRYALKYCMKDQFNVVKAKGTAREAKAENYASSFFRMSKAPPIGATFIRQKMARLLELGAVLPAIKIKSGNHKYTWEPQGALRTYVLRSLYLINAMCLDKTGRDAPQWATLLHSLCQKKNRDLERLKYGEGQNEEELEEFAQDILQRTKEIRREQAVRDFRASCHNAIPCKRCVRGFSADQFEASRLQIRQGIKTYGSLRELQKHHKRSRTCNGFCYLRETYTAKLAASKIA